MIVIKNSRLRAALRYALPLVIIPALIVGGTAVFRGKVYSFVSIAVVLLALLLFSCGFEKKSTGTRRMVIIAVMTALAVLGRFIFLPVPALTPVTAIAVMTAMYFGSEAGFLVGSLSALISNMYAGHGVWTPFQMLAWGLLGFFAGVFANRLKNCAASLCIYGFFAGIAYSLIMDTWSVLWYSNTFDLALLLKFTITALPHTAVYIVSNIFFLLVMRKPFGEKFDRLSVRYGV